MAALSPPSAAPSAASTSYTDQVAATTFKRLHPSAYLRRFLDAGVREDARHLDHFRPATISLGPVSTAHGSAFVKLQNTVCIAAVKAEVATPLLSRPDQGFLVPNVELPALSSTRFKPGPPGDEAQVLTDRLLTFLNSSSTLDRTHLVIQPGAAVWCLYLDITFISYDGNALDAAVLASMAALRHTSLPNAVFHPETSETRHHPDGGSAKLRLNNLPLCASFGVFEAAQLLADPSAFESSLVNSHASIGILAPSSPAESSTQTHTCYLYQSGSLRTIAKRDESDAAAAVPAAAQSDQQNLDACIRLAKLRCDQLAHALFDAEARHA
ncbi:uncharacterized protein PFL1_05193 [Pseudozyma flocculosa PF-1]|uniref:Ribosomal RNA-processing protein 43 n=2 Tax=Pseudozyma flocculosa TaxID=84751 RepID=A0A5C3F8G3_9BASI|nr:uncharacterized protein PFL1_05193 [Pseudozyma flocculosa PF-1]EPQ27270.1 hypothetical protein PFL1_05193 [Pseudozyma flocculosa PF-1]SPO39641.1 related to Exosome complex exonuclease RRP43 [Pseudozyma flocculosa]